MADRKKKLTFSDLKEMMRIATQYGLTKAQPEKEKDGYNPPHQAHVFRALVERKPFGMSRYGSLRVWATDNLDRCENTDYSDKVRHTRREEFNAMMQVLHIERLVDEFEKNVGDFKDIPHAPRMLRKTGERLQKTFE